jgi:hypothetical protein
MKRQACADAAMAVAILCLGASLIFAGRSLLRLRLAGSNHTGSLAMDELVGATAAGVGAAVALWWLLALLFACLSALAQARGLDGLARATAAWSPAFMRRLVAVVLGLNLLSAPLAMASQPASAATGLEGHVGTVSTVPLNSNPALSRDVLPAPGISAASTFSDPGIDPAWTPQAPTVDPGPLARPATRPAAESGPGANPEPSGMGGEVVVHTGDSLWSIVADSLGSQATDMEVAEAWPQWYRTNRGVIGADPNFIVPGQVLHQPAG